MRERCLNDEQLLRDGGLSHRPLGAQVTWNQLEQYLFPRLRDMWKMIPFRKAKPLDGAQNVFLRKVRCEMGTQPREVLDCGVRVAKHVFIGLSACRH